MVIGGEATRILGIGTAEPAHRVSRSQSLELALELHGSADRRLGAFLQRLYRNSGIDSRSTVLPDFTGDPTERWLFPPTPRLRPEPSTATRNAIYAKTSPSLAVEAAICAFASTGEDPSRVTHLVTASCTGFAAPGFDLELLKALPLGAGTQRFNIGFMGCFAAFPALRLADHICRSTPGALVLVVALELCSLHFAVGTEDTPPPADALVANSLFADGAAAALLASGRPVGRPSFALGPFLSRVLPGTEAGMAWTIGETGFSMRLAGSVPAALGEAARSIADGAAAAAGIDRRDVRTWAVHPGGRAIVDRLEEELEPGEGGFAESREVLRSRGNMSSATVLHVLDLALRGGREGPVFACAFGPGLTAESCILELEA